MRVGKTGGIAYHRWYGQVYPYSCGEVRFYLLNQSRLHRFIPTRVGKTYKTRIDPYIAQVYPYSCGED